jgi:ankyrin repeat protein
MTPLMLAALNGHEIIAGFLANAGHDANARNNAGNTALHLASQRGDADVVRLLLGIGASRREINDARMNAEDLAERFGHDAVAAALDGN